MTASLAPEVISPLEPLKAAYQALAASIEAIAVDFPGALPASPDDEGAIRAFEVTMPLVGSFSAGKSSLINAYLGQRVLKTRLTPTTAVPTEIRFGAPRAEVLDHQGKLRRLDLEAFKAAEFSSDKTALIRLYLDLPRLAAFPELVLVDVPGLESGLRTHDTAIKSYLPTSVAYLLVAEMECGLTGAVLDVLRELHLHDKPVAVALTKSDKKTVDAIPGILDHNRRTMREILGHDRFALFGSSIRDKAQTGLEQVLSNLSDSAVSLFRSRFRPGLAHRADLLVRHLEARLTNMDADTETIEARMRECKQELADLQRTVARECDRLDVALLRAEGNVVNQVKAAVSDAAGELAGLRGEDAFNQRLNALIRQTTTAAMKAEIEPLAQQSLDHIGALVDEHTGEFNFELPPIGGGGSSTPGFIQGLYTILPWSLVELVESFVNIFRSSPRGPSEDEIRNRMLDQVQNEILPQVVTGLAPQVHETVSTIGRDIREKVERHLTEQATTLEQALADCLAEKSQREDQAEARRQAVEAALAEARRVQGALAK